MASIPCGSCQVLKIHNNLSRHQQQKIRHSSGGSVSSVEMSPPPSPITTDSPSFIQMNLNRVIGNSWLQKYFHVKGTQPTQTMLQPDIMKKHAEQEIKGQNKP